MKQRYHGTVVLCCAAIAPNMGASQDAVQLPDIVLEASDNSDGSSDSETIVATGISVGGKLNADILDVPASVSVITSKEMSQRSADSVEKVLSYTAGVVTDSYGADDRFDYFSIRGFDAYQYRDGLTLGENFGGVREEPFAYERVEVFKGANSSLFGVSDPGGSVNYVTKKPRGERFGSIYGSLGSFDSKEVGLDFGDTLNADGTLSYRFTGLIRDAEKEYPYSENDEIFSMLGLSWRPSDATELTFVIDYLNRDDVPGSGGFPVGYDFDRGDTFYGEPDFNFRGTERTTATLIARHDMDNGLSFGATARFSKASSDFGYAYVQDDEPVNDVERAFFANDKTNKSAIADAHLTYEALIGNVVSTTLVGVEVSYSDETNLTYYGAAPTVDFNNPVPTGAPNSVPLSTSEDTEIEGHALFFQQDLDWNDRVIASLGLRHDWIDVTVNDNLTNTVERGKISETTGRFGLTYKVTPDLSLYGSYAQSVLPADIGVEPEEGEQYELGMKWRPAGSNTLLSASIYELSKTNIAQTNDEQETELIGEVRVRGIDLEAKAEIGAFGVTASYSYLDPEIIENDNAATIGKQPNRVPNHIASLWGSYTWEGIGHGRDLTVGLGGRYNGGYYFDNTNTGGQSGKFFVVDAAVAYDLTEQTTLAINVSNLFDEKHVAFGAYADFYSPGREITAQLRHSW